MKIFYILADYEAGALHGKVFTTKELCHDYAIRIGLTDGKFGKLCDETGSPVAVIRTANLIVD